MSQFRKFNLIFGWIAFLIAAVVYILTIEPTVSFWDCGEFITSSYKLEVGHPPGAPFFMLLGRIFTLFSFGNVELVPKTVNIMSALASAFTILFLFWTITHLAKRALAGYNEISRDQILPVIASGLVGALAFTFTDSFWFSATEGEVYGLSSLFTAIVFWAILRWENIADEKHANRWLIFIAYMMGLSIGVHLLNLLAIPAMALIYYFRKYKVSTSGIIYTAIISIVALLFIMYGVVQGSVKLASSFELFFVNTLGLPFNSGAIFYLILIAGLLIYGIYYTYKKQKVVFNTILTIFAVILIGYSSFALILIRSVADPPMNQNSPDELFSFQSYLNREQYGQHPLLFGQYFNAEVQNNEQGDAVYAKEDGEYVIIDHKIERQYDPEYTTFFPRMYSRRGTPDHVKGYLQWTGLESRKEKPTFADNLEFFFRYQVNHMYIRYFMWNFAGRQNDIQGHGGPMKGNWISGIPFIDNARLGDQSKLPDYLKDNEARNTYYFFPFILGLIGLYFHFKADNKNAWVVLLLFFFTGLAIVLYLNQTPFQPRERDYAYAGSFYAFSIWIGFGVLGIHNWLKQHIHPKASIITTLVASLVLVPGILASENWDDHDRSGRYTAREFAKNYLKSCEEQGIIFTNGDNDTFPLWYVQEVEGFRTDLKVMNLSYLRTDWYINQMRQKTYEAEPVPFSIDSSKYETGNRSIIYLQNRVNRYVDVRQVIDFIASDKNRTKLRRGANQVNYSPTKKFKLPVDSAQAINTGTVSKGDAGEIVDTMRWKVDKSYIDKSEMMKLDLLANNNWERPLYFAITVGPSAYLNLKKYFQLDGMTYRIVPIETSADGRDIGRIDTDVMYNNLMNEFNYGGISNEDVYLDENNRRMAMNLKNNFSRLAGKLIEEGKEEKAMKVLDKITNLTPHEQVAYNYSNLFIADNYIKLGAVEKAKDMLRTLADKNMQQIRYFNSLSSNQLEQLKRDRRRAFAVAKNLITILQRNNLTEFKNEITTLYNQTLNTKLF